MADSPAKGDIFTLTDEEGKDEEFELLGTCEYDSNTYYALASLSDDSEEYVILRTEQDDGETVLVTIDDDDEFDAVADIFDNDIFADIDYDEDIEEGEEEDE